MPQAILLEIPVTQLSPLPDQPRRYFDPEKLADLAFKIAENGVLQPLLVRLHPELEGHFQIVVGERRWRASQNAGLATVPCTVRSLSDREALELALMENLDREDLNPVEEAEAILRILQSRTGLDRPSLVEHFYRMRNATRRNKGEHKMPSPATEVIRAFFSGRQQNWESFVVNKLPVLDLPEVLRMALMRGDLEYTKARLLAKVVEPAVIEQLMQQAIQQDWNLERLRQAVKPYRRTRPKPPSFQLYLDAIGLAVAGIEDPSLKQRVELLFRERLVGILEEIQIMTVDVVTGPDQT